jgi:hypothetical protein
MWVLVLAVLLCAVCSRVSAFASHGTFTKSTQMRPVASVQCTSSNVLQMGITPDGSGDMAAFRNSLIKQMKREESEL